MLDRTVPIAAKDNALRVWSLLDRRRKRQLTALLCVLFFSVILEALTLTMVIPLINSLARPDMVVEYISVYSTALDDFSAEHLRLFIVTIFIALVVISAGVRLFYLWASMRLSFAIGADLTEAAFEKTLLLPYVEQTRLNSSDILTNLMVKMQSIVYSGLVPFLAAIGAGVLCVAILASLFVITPIVTIALILLTVAIVSAIVFFLRTPLRRTSEKIASLQPQFAERMQIARGGIREIILDGSQKYFAQEMSHILRDLRMQQSRGAFLGGAPRFMMEAVFIFTIVGCSYWMLQSADDPILLLPELSVLAFGAMKILPSAQLIVTNWALIRTGRAAIQDALDLVELQVQTEVPATPSLDPVANLTFEKAIELKDVWYRYDSAGPFILKGIDLSIHKGEILGIVGQTGAGKSTLIDLLMGLLLPTKGSIMVDGVPLGPEALFNWRRRVAHVPQSIYLTDGSAAENIAFGIPREAISKEKVRYAAYRASIPSFVDDGAFGFATPIGERGIRISGGQRQRIGIARALYKSADIIVLDEATSALDGKTEERIMETITKLAGDTTVLMIAHRLTTLKNCDRIIQMEAGEIARICTYEELGS